MSSIADDITRSQFSSSATSSTSKNHLATIAGLLHISFFIVCWYWSSSINAVATQRLLSQTDASHGEANHDASEVHSPSSMLAAVLLTAAQLVVGSMASLVLIWISKFVLPSYSISAIASSSSSSSHVIVGLLHCSAVYAPILASHSAVQASFKSSNSWNRLKLSSSRP